MVFSERGKSGQIAGLQRFKLCRFLFLRLCDLRVAVGALLYGLSAQPQIAQGFLPHRSFQLPDLLTIQAERLLYFPIGHDAVLHALFKFIRLCIEFAQLVLVRHACALQFVRTLLQLCPVLVREVGIRADAFLDLLRLYLLRMLIGTFPLVCRKSCLCRRQIRIPIVAFAEGFPLCTDIDLGRMA